MGADELKAEEVVAAAGISHTPLYHRFTWDDEAAAAEYRARKAEREAARQEGEQ